MTTNTSVLQERLGPVVTLTLNRPAVLNAIDLSMAEMLRDHLMAAASDTEIRAVVITGSGRGFCAGGDLRFAVAANPEAPGASFLALTEILHEAIEVIRTMAKPVVAAINGPAAGAGLFLALACDLRLIGESAYLKQSNTSYGLSLPAGGTFTLPRLIGMGRALELVFLDEPISSVQAQQWGLVRAVVPDGELMTAAYQLAQRAAQMPVATLGRVKQLMNDAYVTPLHEQLAAEQKAITISADSGEGREGLAAFLDKRRPDFANTNVSTSGELTP